MERNLSCPPILAGRNKNLLESITTEIRPDDQEFEFARIQILRFRDGLKMLDKGWRLVSGDEGSTQRSDDRESKTASPEAYRCVSFQSGTRRSLRPASTLIMPARYVATSMNALVEGAMVVIVRVLATSPQSVRFDNRPSCRMLPDLSVVSLCSS